jgi:hypothetical protein
MFNPGNIHYGISDRNGGMIYGGIGAMQMMVERHPRGVFGWIKRVDRGVLMHIIGSDE